MKLRSYSIMKLLARLTFSLAIIALLTYSSFAQSDSVQIKKEITALLKKHGYSSYQININSYNQSGGQTAFSITNNYTYSDPHYCPDSSNFMVGFIDSNEVTIAICPKQGAWTKPFVAYPDTFLIDAPKPIRILGHCDWSHYAGYSFEGGMYINYKGFQYLCWVESLETSCTSEMPLCSNIYKKNSFFVFGDYADQNKWFAYDSGQIYWLKTDNNFKPFPHRYQLKSVMTLPIEK
jgi:hypothetical protein